MNGDFSDEFWEFLEEYRFHAPASHIAMISFKKGADSIGCCLGIISVRVFE